MLGRDQAAGPLGIRAVDEPRPDSERGPGGRAARRGRSDRGVRAAPESLGLARRSPRAHVGAVAVDRHAHRGRHAGPVAPEGGEDDGPGVGQGGRKRPGRWVSRTARLRGGRPRDAAGLPGRDIPDAHELVRVRDEEHARVPPVTDVEQHGRGRGTPDAHDDPGAPVENGGRRHRARLAAPQDGLEEPATFSAP